MPEPTPAETIRAAATRLREAAERATPTPWRVTEDYDGRWFVEPVAIMLADPDDPETWYDAQPDAAYIALVNPVVGLALADWLDVTERDVGTSSLAYHAALAVARALLAPSGEEGGR